MRSAGCDSRKVQPGSLFFALHGAKTDGNAFVKQAVERGAIAIVSEERQPADLPEKVLWIRVREARKSLAIAAANFFGHPGQALKMAAVTGTNGKTTTTSIIDSIIKASGAKTGLVRHDRVSHAGWRLSGAEHDAGIGGLAGISCGDSRRRRTVRGARSEFARAVAGSTVDLPFRRGGFHESDARAHGLSQEFRRLLCGEAAAVRRHGSGSSGCGDHQYR